MSLLAKRRANQAASNQPTGIHPDLLELFSESDTTRDVVVDTIHDCDLADLKTYALTLGIKVQKKSSKALTKQIADWYDAKWTNLNVQPTEPQSLEYTEFVIPTNLVNPDDVGLLRETGDSPSIWVSTKSTSNVNVGDVCLSIKVGNGATFINPKGETHKSNSKFSWNMTQGCLTIRGTTKSEERIHWVCKGKVADIVEQAIQSVGDRLTDRLALLRQHGGYDS